MITLPVSTEAAHAVRGPTQGNWTYADWENLPDDGNRYEIIERVLYVTAAPSNFHNWTINRLVTYVGVPADQQKLAYWFTAPHGVIMPDCVPVQPDFFMVLRDRAEIIRDRRIFGVPDLIIEAISPGSAAYDEGVKLEAYARAGVPEYGVIDPATRKMRLYALEMPGQFAAPHEFGEGDSLSLTCLPEITLNVSNLFANAPDTTL